MGLEERRKGKDETHSQGLCSSRAVREKHSIRSIVQEQR